jgi:hypothetical protein
MPRSSTKLALKRARSHCASTAELEQQFRSMIDKALGAIVTCEPKADQIFGEFSEFVSVARSVAFHEGRLLEWGIIAVARCNPDLVILPPDRPMPIVPAAIELLKKNEWREIQGIRLPSEVHASKTYTPDLFIANRRRHSGLIIDVKRSLASYAENRLEDLRFRMLAVAAIASSWLGERQGPVLVEVGTAIIDGADLASDHDKGVFKLSEVGDLLEVEGAGIALARLREMFSERVQHELRSQCRKVLQAELPQAVPHGPYCEADPWDPDALIRCSAPSQGATVSTSSSPQANVRVGFARSRLNS